MDLKEKTNLVAEATKHTKETWVASHPDAPDTGIILHFYRGDQQIAAVLCHLDRDVALKAALIGATGFNADTMAVTFESYHAMTAKSPLTGEHWVPHEMQFVAETYPDRKDWVTECITIMVHDRSGQCLMHAMTFQIKDGQVLWDDDEHTTDQVDGYMFEVLQDAMARPKMGELIKKQANDSLVGALMAGLVTDEEARLFHCDVATAKALQERDLATQVMLAAEADSERQKWIMDRFGPSAEVLE